MEQSELGERLERYFKEKYWPVEIGKIFVSTKILMWNSSERKACMLLKYFIPTFSKPTYVFWRLEMSFVLLCFSALLQCKHKKIKTEMKPEKKKKSFGELMRTPRASEPFCDGEWDLSPHPFQAATNVSDWKNSGWNQKTISYLAVTNFYHG